MTIGELAARSGFAQSALRYYENLGLITSTRTSGNQRRYERATLRRLAFIRSAQRVGLSLEEITEALADGSRVELRGFGAFSVKNRPARTGRNPRTGESVTVEEKWVPFFKTGKELRERLNADHAK